MRKLLWCCSAVGVLAAGGLFSAVYFACRCPDSTLGRFVYAAATVTYTLQPIHSLASMVDRANEATVAVSQDTLAGSVEECIPPDPQPVAPEPAPQIVAAVDEMPMEKPEPEPAPIIIHEDEPMPRAEVLEAPPSTIDIAGLQGQEMPDSACPMVMPYCVDDDEPAPRPNMPYAEADKKQADGSDVSEDDAFKAWMKLFDEKGKGEKTTTGEELPAPHEEPGPASKCEEDIHRHEQYPGCPYVTCPYTGKSYPSRAPMKKAGKEESSEEAPPPKHSPRHDRGEKEGHPRTQGVDTMEYRPSDGGLNEYGRGPL
jgi:hypothetical protein